MESSDLNAKVSRFWGKYILISKAYNIPEHLIRWHVRHAELYIKAHSLRLKLHSAKTLDEYCQAKGRNIYLKDYQYCQMIDALRILFLDMVLPSLFIFYFFVFSKYSQAFTILILIIHFKFIS